MKALDTDVIVRLLTRDDPEQAAVAADEMRGGPLFLPLSVLLETEWVLRHAYKFPQGQISTALEHLMALDQITVEREDVARRAVDWHGRGLNLADAMHLAASAGATEMITFDRTFARDADAFGCAPTVRLLGTGGAE